MQHAFQGHLVVIANEATYSDGETFIEGIKRLGLAPIIGKTSSGAGVWLSDRNTLMDNGMVRAAEYAQITSDGKFLIEGVGVKPDIEVDNLPRATFLGGDAQLDTAVAKVKEAMRAKPRAEPKPGNYPRPVKLP
jgi:tricorn protease